MNENTQKVTVELRDSEASVALENRLRYLKSLLVLLAVDSCNAAVGDSGAVSPEIHADGLDLASDLADEVRQLAYAVMEGRTPA